MHIVFQTPTFGESEHDYRWGLVDGVGNLRSTWASPEAAFIEAAHTLGVAAATLDLVRTGPNTFEVRSKRTAGRPTPPGMAGPRSPRASPRPSTGGRS
jgi:hypothetical protein